MATNDHGSCPHCSADLNGGSIWLHFFQKHLSEGHGTDASMAEADRVSLHYGATRTSGQWGREIAIYDRDRDRTVAYKCPDCGHEWSR